MGTILSLVGADDDEGFSQPMMMMRRMRMMRMLTE
jgi:hypothetical protein